MEHTMVSSLPFGCKFHFRSNSKCINVFRSGCGISWLVERLSVLKKNSSIKLVICVIKLFKFYIYGIVKWWWWW